ncbi:hypothetical protein M3J09_008206 [Ascochyta lentis]
MQHEPLSNRTPHPHLHVFSFFKSPISAITFSANSAQPLPCASHQPQSIPKQNLAITIPEWIPLNPSAHPKVKEPEISLRARAHRRLQRGAHEDPRILIAIQQILARASTSPCVPIRKATDRMVMEMSHPSIQSCHLSCLPREQQLENENEMRMATTLFLP